MGEGRRHVYPSRRSLQQYHAFCKLDQDLGELQKQGPDLYSVEPSAHSSHPIRKDPSPFLTLPSPQLLLLAHCQSPELTQHDCHSRWALVLSSLSLHALPVPPS